MKRLITLLIVVIGGSIIFGLYYMAGSLPVNKTVTATKEFIIPPGQGLNEIANRLSHEGLIRNKIVFYLVVKWSGFDKKIQAGAFRLSPSMDAYEIAKLLTHGTLDTWVTLIEGTRKEEMATVVSQSLNIPESEFLREAREGYLFPDTYLIERSATAGSVLELLYETFDKRYTERHRQLARVKGLSDEEVIILASIVEKEAAGGERDKREVASILLKRLQNDWPLQADITIVYALGYQSDLKTWWKPHLSQDDLEIDSPYNTYTNKGLPPTPISNPGTAAIEAVLNANSDTPYWFYLSDRQGNMHYAKTHEEHEANIGRYLR